MKIKELQKILSLAQDTEKELFIPCIENEKTSSIGYSFDDVGNLELYQVIS